MNDIVSHSFLEATQIHRYQIGAYIVSFDKIASTRSGEESNMKRVFSDTYIEPLSRDVYRLKKAYEPFVEHTLSSVDKLLKPLMWLQEGNFLIRDPQFTGSSYTNKNKLTDISKVYKYNIRTHSFTWIDKFLKRKSLISEELDKNIKEFQKLFAYEQSIENAYFRMNSIMRAMMVMFLENLSVDIKIETYDIPSEFQQGEKSTVFVFKKRGEIPKIIFYGKNLSDFTGDYITQSIINSFVGYTRQTRSEANAQAQFLIHVAASKQEPKHHHYHTWHSGFVDLYRFMMYSSNILSNSEQQINEKLGIEKFSGIVPEVEIGKGKKLNKEVFELLDLLIRIDQSFPKTSSNNDIVKYKMLLFLKLGLDNKIIDSGSFSGEMKDKLKDLLDIMKNEDDEEIIQIINKGGYFDYKKYKKSQLALQKILNRSPLAKDIFKNVVRKIVDNPSSRRVSIFTMNAVQSLLLNKDSPIYKKFDTSSSVSSTGDTDTDFDDISSSTAIVPYSISSYQSDDDEFEDDIEENTYDDTEDDMDSEDMNDEDKDDDIGYKQNKRRGGFNPDEDY